MSDMSTIPPATDTDFGDNDGPRENDLITGKKFKLTMGNAVKDVQVIRVFEKKRDKGWHVEFHDPLTMAQNNLALDVFMDNAVMTSRWLRDEVYEGPEND